MTTRILPPEEWPKLAGTLLEAAWPHLDHERARIVVVEDEGQIVGCLSLFPVWHLEGAWVAPAYRARIGVGRRLLTAIRETIRTVGATEVWTMAVNREASRMCRRFGSATLLACEHFAVNVER